MLKVKNKIHIIIEEKINGNQLYLIALAMFILGESLSSTMFQVPGMIYSICKMIPLLLIFIKVLLYDIYSPKLFWISVIAIGLGGVIAIKSGYKEPLFWLLMILGAKDVPWKKILQIYVIIKSSLLILTVSASLLGVIENLQYIVEDRGGIRNSFGTIYPTDFASQIFFLILVIFYLLNKELKLWQCAIATVVAGLVFYFCNTRLDVGCIFLLILAFFLLYLYQNKKTVTKNYHGFKGWKKKIFWVMPVSMIIMVVATVFYKSDSFVFSKMNAILSNRLQLGKIGLNRYGVSLFGQPVEMVGNGGSTVLLKEYFFVDCSYLYIFLRYGLIFFFVVMAVYVLCCRKFKNDPYFLVAIALVSINCMIAHHLMELAYCPFALALFASVPEMEGKDSRSKISLWSRLNL